MKVYVVTTFDKDSACPSVYKTLERANEVFERAIKTNLYFGEKIASDERDIITDGDIKVLRLVRFRPSKENLLLTETTI